MQLRYTFGKLNILLSFRIRSDISFDTLQSYPKRRNANPIDPSTVKITKNFVD